MYSLCSSKPFLPDAAVPHSAATPIIPSVAIHRRVLPKQSLPRTGRLIQLRLVERKHVGLHPLVDKLVALLEEGVVAPVTSLDVVNKDASSSVLAVVSGLGVEVASLVVKSSLDLLEGVGLGLDILVAKDTNEVTDLVSVGVGGPQPGRGHAGDKTRSEDGSVPVNNAADDVSASLGEINHDVAGEQVGVPKGEALVLVVVKGATLGHHVENATAVIKLDRVKTLGVIDVEERAKTAEESIVQDLLGVEIKRLIDARDSAVSGSSLVDSLDHVDNVRHSKRLDGNGSISGDQVLDLVAGIDKTSARHGNVTSLLIPESKTQAQIEALLVGKVKQDLTQGLARNAIEDHEGHVNGVVLGTIILDDLGSLGLRGVLVEPLQSANVAGEGNTVVLVGALMLIKLDGVTQNILVGVAIGISDVDGEAAIDRERKNGDASLVMLGGRPELLAELNVVSLALVEAPSLAGGVVSDGRHLDLEIDVANEDCLIERLIEKGQRSAMI